MSFTRSLTQGVFTGPVSRREVSPGACISVDPVVSEPRESVSRGEGGSLVGGESMGVYFPSCRCVNLGQSLNFLEAQFHAVFPFSLKSVNENTH